MKLKLLLSAAFFTALVLVAFNKAGQRQQPLAPAAEKGIYSAPSPEELEAENASRQAKLKGKDTKQQADNTVDPWSRDEQIDQMTGKTSISVSTSSTNFFDLEFPHVGKHHAYLIVRRHPRYGTDVVIAVDAGQLICDYRNCRVLIRFDDRQASYFSVSEPSDRSSKTWFVNDSSRFIKSLERSKTVVAELQFYRQGNRALKFETAGFKRP